MRAALVLFLLAPLASADVRVVSPIGPYTQIQDAVDAANDGDLVLVKPGTYPGFHVQSKSLCVAADAPPPAVHVQGTSIVSDLLASQTVCLSGLFSQGSSTGSSNEHLGFYSINNQGSVRCQGCWFAGTYDWSLEGDGFDSTRIESSSDVALVSCSLWGSESSFGMSSTPFVAGCGARCVGSTVTIFDCTIQGGWGASSFWGSSGGSGGRGLVSDSSTIFLSRTTVAGGDGGDGDYIGVVPGVGGVGVYIYSNSLLRVIDSSFSGGFNGDFSDGHVAGSAPDYVGGTYDFLAGSARTLAVSANPLRELQSLNLSFHGAPGEQVFLLVGLETAVQWDPLRLANFLIAPPHYRTLFLGTTNAAGDLSVSRPFGDLGGTTQSRMYFLQPLFSGAGGAQQLGTPVTLAVLDQAF